MSKYRGRLPVQAFRPPRRPGAAALSWICFADAEDAGHPMSAVQVGARSWRTQRARIGRLFGPGVTGVSYAPFRWSFKPSAVPSRPATTTDRRHGAIPPERDSVGACFPRGLRGAGALPPNNASHPRMIGGGGMGVAPPDGGARGRRCLSVHPCGVGVLTCAGPCGRAPRRPPFRVGR